MKKKGKMNKGNEKENHEVKEIELTEQKKPNGEETMTVRRPDTMYSQGVNDIFSYLRTNTLKIKPKDTHANSIPIGGYGFSMSIFLFGLCYVGEIQYNSMLLSQLLLMGGFGQVTAGVFEYIKGRSFPTAVYLVYGFFCFSEVSVRVIGKYQWADEYNNDSLASFYFLWILISLSIFLCSFKSNVIFSLKTGVMTLTFLMLTIGYGADSDGVRKTAGAFALTAAVISIYLTLGQLINEGYKKNILPMFPYTQKNGIDIFDTNGKDPTNKTGNKKEK